MWQRHVRDALLLLSGLLAIFLVYILTTRVEPAQTSPPATSQSLARADAGIDRFTFTQTKAGAVQWQIQAQRAHLVEAEHRAVLEGVQVTLYGPKGRELQLSGDEGTIDTAKKNFRLMKRTGTIAVELASGYTILTNHLAWTDERREVATSDPVTITGHGLEVSGRGLIGKLDLEEFQILEDVHVAIAP